MSSYHFRRFCTYQSKRRDWGGRVSWNITRQVYILYIVKREKKIFVANRVLLGGEGGQTNFFCVFLQLYETIHGDITATSHKGNFLRPFVTRY